MTDTPKQRLLEATNETCTAALNVVLAEVCASENGRGRMKYSVSALTLHGVGNKILHALSEIKAAFPRPIPAAWREINTMSPWAVVPCR